MVKSSLKTLRDGSVCLARSFYKFASKCLKTGLASFSESSYTQFNSRTYMTSLVLWVNNKALLLEPDRSGFVSLLCFLPAVYSQMSYAAL